MPQANCTSTPPVARERFFHWVGRLDGWVDSIRQVDVDLNFLLVLYSTVGLYRLVCSVDWMYVGKIFWVGRIHWLPTQCYSWVGNFPPCPLGSHAFGHRDIYPVTCGSMIASQPRIERCYQQESQLHWRQPRRGCRGHIPQYFGWGDVNGNIPQYYTYFRI